MRIAVPTNDGVTLSEHFGRSATFLIFELENGRITKRETRPNRAHHAAADGECHHGGGRREALSRRDSDRSRGLRRGPVRRDGRAAEALKAGGISPVPVSASGSAEEIVAAYAAGSLITTADSFCRCGH